MRGLGELEAVTMDVLWRTPGPMSVRDVLNILTERRSLAYTTVMTVLDNLHRKGYVRRAKLARAYLYEATFTRGQAAADAMRQVLDEATDIESALLHFVDSMTDVESAVIRDGLDRRRSNR